MRLIVAWLLLSVVFTVMFATYHEYRVRKFTRRLELDGEVDFDDWKNGSPNDPVPDDAKPFKNELP